METIHFLKTNSPHISNVGLSSFGLNFHSDVYNKPEKYGVRQIKEPEDLFFIRNLQYEVDFGITNKQARQYAAQFRRSKWNRLYEKITRRMFKTLSKHRRI